VGLWADIIPDKNWAKRGSNIERNGNVLTLRRAAVLRAGIEMRDWLLLAFFWAAIFLGEFSVHILIGSFLVLAVKALDGARMAALPKHGGHFLFPPSVAVKVAAIVSLLGPSFVAFVLQTVKGMLPQTVFFPTFSHELERIVGIGPVLFAVSVAAAIDAWQRRTAALASDQPEMDIMLPVPWLGPAGASKT
jgi:hypothetical protein